MSPAKWSNKLVEVSFRVIESISPRQFLASNSTVFSASLLCLEFWQIYWCHIILSPGSWFSIFFEVALGRYWKEPITHLAILAQPPPHWITVQSHCQNQLILLKPTDIVKTNWYCSCRRMSITFVWHRKVYGPVLHWTEGTEIFPNWRSFDAVESAKVDLLMVNWNRQVRNCSRIWSQQLAVSRNGTGICYHKQSL